MSGANAQVEIPDAFLPVFEPPLGAVQYRGAWGGRGSSKSYTCALMASVFGVSEKLRILCTREYQSSIRESFHAELKAAISEHEFLANFYDVGVDYIRGLNGTEFIFRGLHRNTSSIKSLAKIDITIVEEAEEVPEAAWLDLEATIFRNSKSELWVIWNPLTSGSPVDKRFRLDAPENARIIEINHNDNPFFPEGLEILRKREQERLDPATYAHVWEGAYLENSDAQVLSGKVQVKEFTAQASWDGPYFGADWGFAQDPTAAVRCWVNDETLYVDYEAGKVGLEIDQTAQFLIDRMPDVAMHNLRGDSARPETISYLKRHGLPRTESVKKWPGSVEDGIAHMRSYKAIVIHPRCTETVKETRLYSYKVDRLSGDIMPAVVDAHNHYIDAVRYAVGPLIKRRFAQFTGVQVRGL